MYPSEKPATADTTQDPLPKGLKATWYRVRHFGHSTQWRIRSRITNASHENWRGHWALTGTARKAGESPVVELEAPPTISPDELISLA